MKIGCYCGETIIDTTDYLPWKAWLTPDQDWFDTFEAIDDQVIRPLVLGTLKQEAAFGLSRKVISHPQRAMWQCVPCGRLYVEDEHGDLHCYAPNDDRASKTILKGRRSAGEA